LKLRQEPQFVALVFLEEGPHTAPVGLALVVLSEESRQVRCLDEVNETFEVLVLFFPPALVVHAVVQRSVLLLLLLHIALMFCQALAHALVGIIG
jgi:hypothetical protein